MAQNFKITYPQADTNMIKNPSFESSASKISGGTNWTAARSAEQQHKGAYSIKNTAGASANTSMLLIDTGGIGLTTNESYLFSCYVYVNSGWDGGNIRIDPQSFTGATVTYNHIYTDGTDPTGSWVYLETRLDTAADAVGNFYIATTSGPGSGAIFYIDSVMVINGTASISYIDGDQEGCIWLGEPHESQSKRGMTRKGGLLKDLTSDLGFYISQILGMGVAPIINLSSPLGQLDGDAPGNTITQPREFTLLGTIAASTFEGMQSTRQGLIKAFSQRLIDKTEPITLEYHGDSKVLEIDCRYVDGLGGTSKQGFLERFGLVLRADNPYWREQAQQGVSLSLTTSLASVAYIVLRDPNGDYSAISSALDAEVRSLAFNPTTNLLYVGGDFTTGGGAPGNGFATYNVETGSWSTLGASQVAGGLAQVKVVKVSPTGDIYIGGDFTSAGGSTANNIAYWNGSAWTALVDGADNGMDNDVEDLIWDEDGNLYIIGAFTGTSAGGVTDRGVIKWDGTNFSALNGTGIADGNARAGIIDDNGDLIVGGTFTTGGGSDGSYILKYTLSATSPAWAAFTAQPNSNVLTLGKSPAGGFYAAGNFTTIGSDTHNYAAYFNGNAWVAMDDGFNQTVNAISVLPDGKVFAGGSFAQTGGGRTFTESSAYWNGVTWYSLDIDLPGTASINAAALRSDGYLAIGFDTSGTATVGNATVSCRGTTYCYPVVKITGASGGSPLQSLVLVQSGSFSDSVVVSPRAIYFDNLTLLENEVFTLDFRPNRWSFTTSARGDVSDKILNGSNVTGFFLTPDNNVVRLYTDNSSTTVDMWWDVLHESIDGVA